MVRSFLVLPHALTSLNSFVGRIDPAWTLETESKSGAIWRLNLLVKHEWSGVSEFFCEKRFENAIQKAMYSGNMNVLEWCIITRFQTDTEILSSAFSCAL